MDAIDGTTSRAQSGRVFPKHRFAGSHLEIGEQFGEACRDLIASHLDKALGLSLIHISPPTRPY